MIRRGIALALLLCFGLFSLESAVADVHDGDAAAADILAVLSCADGTPPGVPPAPGHEVHACHCVHAHGTLDPVSPRLAVRFRDVRAAIGGDFLAPAAVDLDVHLRPPIARA